MGFGKAHAQARRLLVLERIRKRNALFPESLFDVGFIFDFLFVFVTLVKCRQGRLF